MSLLQALTLLAGSVLYILVLTSLMGGLYREFPAIFLYTLFLLFSTATDVAAFYLLHPPSESYSEYFWVVEFSRQTGLFAVVIALVFQAMPDTRRRTNLVRILITLGALFWLGSLIVLKDDHLSLWMTRVIRNLSFCSAIVNMVLWYILIAAERRSMRLLMVTAGLGLRMTGDAIGQALRHFSSVNMNLLGNTVIILSHLLCMFIWWRAFRSTFGEAEAQPAA